LIPILLPVVDKFGIDRVHFGMIIHLNLLIGIGTPPMGIGLYIMTGVAKISFEEVVRAFLALPDSSLRSAVTDNLLPLVYPFPA